VYGETVSFAGTEFSATGLQGGDSVASVTLSSAGAPPTAQVAGSPYAIVASNAVGSGLANYTITYVDGMLTVDPAALTITADDQSKPFGVDFTFAGTEFSAAGLLNADTVDTATLTSAGTPAAAAPGSYPITISGAAGSGLANYTISYVEGTLTVGNTMPVVGDADVTTGATASVDGVVTVMDPDTGQTVTLSIATPPAHGSAIVAQDGSFTYTPAGTYTGPDTFTIEGCDDFATPACDTGTVTVAVYPVAVDDEATVTTEGGTTEVDVQANDIGDAGGVVIVSGPAHGIARVGSIVYTPDAGYSGADQIVYRVCSPNDAALCDDGTLSITVTGGAPETDTGSALGRHPSGAVPPIVVMLLAIGAILGAAAITTRRRSPSR
jgi:VCBS repeat-containing protein